MTFSSLFTALLASLLTHYKPNDTPKYGAGHFINLPILSITENKEKPSPFGQSLALSHSLN
jgi:hypothetical protein